jgi:hypothetical protein
MRITSENIKANLTVGSHVFIDTKGPFGVTYLCPEPDLGFQIDTPVRTHGYDGTSNTISSRDVKNPRVMIEFFGTLAFTD